MATFTETAYYSRQIIKWGGITLLALMIGRVVFNGAIRYWKETHPAPEPPPTMGYGVLPDVAFPENKHTNLTYTLELPTGTYPEFPDRMNVYVMPEVHPNLLALEKSKDEAKQLGFTNEPQRLSDSLYRWNQEINLPATMEIYIFTGAFTYRVDWFTDVNFLTEKQFGTDTVSIDIAKSFLQRGKLLTDDLDTGTSKVSYLKASSGAYKETVSLSEADFVQVDMYRAEVDETYPPVTQDPDRGLVRTIISGNKSVKVIQMDYGYFPVDYSDSQTYPIKTADMAYSELQQGGGYVANLDPDVSNITVRRVELGYYDMYTPQAYFQPVYVFKGDNNFIAYVTAVTTAVSKR